jgi:hypothetical protein
MQATSNLLMIRPVSFGFNEQTARSNAFQTRSTDQQQVQTKALAEFDRLVKILRDNKVNVTVIEDTPQPHTPDSIFPNNWVSFHDTMAMYFYTPCRQKTAGWKGAKISSENWRIALA